MQELVELGVSWLWMGLESPRAGYSKLQGSDTRELTRELREHGIRVQGSTIIGLEHHTPETSWRKSSTRSRTTPISISSCCTRRCRARRCISRCRRKAACCATSITPTFTASSNSISSMPRSRATTPNAFLTGRSGATFELNGPSLYRISRTLLAGWKRYKDWPDARVRERFASEMDRLSGIYSSALWAMEHQFRKVDRNVSEQDRRAAARIQAGVAALVAHDAKRAGSDPAVDNTSRRATPGHGQTYEPPTILERSNWVEA